MKVNEFTTLQRQEIKEVFDLFGLKEKEREIYLALLQSGKNTITPLAQLANFPVTTVQSVLIRLTDLGLVDVTMRKSRHVYEAHDPIVLKKILERKTQEVSQIIPLLQKLKLTDEVAPKIKIYYRERMADIFHEALNCQSKLVYEIVAARDLQEILGEKFHFTKRRIENNVQLRSLRVESQEIKKYSKETHTRELREAKFLPSELTFASSIMFWDKKIAFFTTKDEGLAWVVESESFAKTILQIFELLWSVSRKMETLTTSS